MQLLDSIRFRLSTLFERSHLHDDMAEELRTHIELRADDLERSGVPRAEAERRARMEFGSQQGIREDCEEAAGGALAESVLQDIRFAIRVLRKSPEFTLVAVATLALAIGANAIVFAALNAVLLRPLDVPRVESLYSVHQISDSSANVSYPTYVEMRDRNRSLEDLAAFNPTQAGLDSGRGAIPLWLFETSGNYFDVLGTRPFLGRLFHASDEHGPNSAPYIVLSYGFWHAHFHDNRGVIGRTVQVNKHPYTILGVTPPEFHGTLMFFHPEVFMPMVNEEQIEGSSFLNERGNRAIFMTFGHLKSGVSTEQAAADFESISRELERTYPNEYSFKPLKLERPALYGDHLGRPIRAFLTALLVLSGLILLAACANLGSLFAARAADRSREVALRLALGAGRSRIFRYMFTEAILVSIAGGILGIWGSALLLRSLRQWQPFPQWPVNIPVTPDGNVYAIALLLALVSGLLFGAVPFGQVLRTDPFEVLKSGGRNASSRRIGARDVLVAVQIAICAVLVTSSMVAVRGLVRSLHSNAGFEPHKTTLVNTFIEMAGYHKEDGPAMQKRMIDALERIPGVQSVGLVDWIPLSGDDRTAFVFTDETTDLRQGNAKATSSIFSASPEYFQAAQTKLLYGRNLTWHDDAKAQRVAVVNLEFAKRIFGSTQNALGRNYKMKDGSRIQVVGIVEDGKYASLTEDAKPAMFLSFQQMPATESTLVVRSEIEPERLAEAIKTKLKEVDPGVPFFIQTWDRELDIALFPARVATVSLAILGAMGAMLSLTGISGIAAYSVSKRMRELGIRMALGAQKRQVLRTALARAVQLLVFGSAAGLLLGVLTSRVLASIVYQATPRDPLVLTGVVIAMALLGLLATWIPAQRALSIEPLALLREE